MKIRTYNIDYETDGESIDLPKELFFDVNEDFEADNQLANLISDETGYLVKGFQFDKVKTYFVSRHWDGHANAEYDEQELLEFATKNNLDLTDLREIALQKLDEETEFDLDFLQNLEPGEGDFHEVKE